MKSLGKVFVNITGTNYGFMKTRNLNFACVHTRTRIAVACDTPLMSDVFSLTSTT